MLYFMVVKMKKLLHRLSETIYFLTGGRKMVFINYFCMQVELGWITIEQVPKKYRQKVKELLEAGGAFQNLDHKEEQ